MNDLISKRVMVSAMLAKYPTAAQQHNADLGWFWDAINSMPAAEIKPQPTLREMIADWRVGVYGDALPNILNRIADELEKR